MLGLKFNRDSERVPRGKIMFLGGLPRRIKTRRFHEEESSVVIAPAQWVHLINTLRSRHNGRHYPDDISKCIFLNENVWISLKISLKCVPTVRINRINNIPALAQIMAWCRIGDKPLSEPMLTRYTDAYMPHKGEMSLTPNVGVARVHEVRGYDMSDGDVIIW